jgi:hypothetical protein
MVFERLCDSLIVAEVAKWLLETVVEGVVPRVTLTDGEGA